MDSSQALIRELIAGGMSRRAIARAVGRNDRLIGFIEKGAKPGEHLAPALAELRQRQAAGLDLRRPVAETARRTRQVVNKTTGEVREVKARVRRRTVVRGRTGTWATGTVKQQGASSGGRGLMPIIRDAADAGQAVAFTVTVSRHVTVNGTSGSGKQFPGLRRDGGSVTWEAGDGRDVLDDVETEHNGNVTAYVVANLFAEGYISGQEEDGSTVVEAIEVRAY